MARFAVRFLLSVFTVLLLIIAWNSSDEYQWTNTLPKPGQSQRQPPSPPVENAKAKPQAGTKPIPDATNEKEKVGTTRGKSFWAELPLRHPVKEQAKLPTDPPRKIPKIQYDFPAEDKKAKKIRELRLNTVRNAFRHDWAGYHTYAWMKDEVQPLTGEGLDNFGGWAATLVDSLDTLLIMNLQSEFDEAVVAVEKIDFSKAQITMINIFETNIRYLGGFLAAYDLSGREILLEKAAEVGEMLYVAFDTPNHLPVARWDWRKAANGEEQSQTSTLLAEFGSFALEFTRLSQLTGDSKYFDLSQRIADLLRDQQDQTKLPGLWPLLCYVQRGDCIQHFEFSLGAMADSTYEYLPKEYLLLGGQGQAPYYRQMYEKAITAAKKHLFFRPQVPDNLDILMSGIRRMDGTEEGDLTPEGQHLACYLGGMVGIASKIFELDDLDTARKLTEGCVWAYDATQRGIMPEVFRVIPCKNQTKCEWDDYVWREEAVKFWRANHDTNEVVAEDLNIPRGMVDVSDRRYILRPEAIEAIFIMYRITGDPEWMERGWKMFKKIEQATATEIAHASLIDVTVLNPKDEDVVYNKMESFWTAETLKYFYLLFCDPKYISLDKFVFNTEAHPFLQPGVS